MYTENITTATELKKEIDKDNKIYLIESNQLRDECTVFLVTVNIPHQHNFVASDYRSKGDSISVTTPDKDNKPWILEIKFCVE
jgi:hypothetical protein